MDSALTLAIAVDAIGAERVDRDQHDVRLRNFAATAECEGERGRESMGATEDYHEASS